LRLQPAAARAAPRSLSILFRSMIRRASHVVHHHEHKHHNINIKAHLCCIAQCIRAAYLYLHHFFALKLHTKQLANMPPKRVKKVMTLPINVIFSHLQVRRRHLDLVSLDSFMNGINDSSIN
jgi:hypothetical protein